MPWTEFSRVSTTALIMFLQAGFEILCATNIMVIAQFTSQNIHIMNCIHRLACQAVVDEPKISENLF